MAVRRTIPVKVSFRIESVFTFSGEMTINAYRGGSVAQDVVNWGQGDPAITPVNLAAFTAKFYASQADAQNDEDPITSSSGSTWSIGDQNLGELITVTSFVDNGDGTGSLTIEVDPSGITSAELSTQRDIYVVVEITQPDVP